MIKVYSGQSERAGFDPFDSRSPRAGERFFEPRREIVFAALGAHVQVRLPSEDTGIRVEMITVDPYRMRPLAGSSAWRGFVGVMT